MWNDGNDECDFFSKENIVSKDKECPHFQIKKKNMGSKVFDMLKKMIRPIIIFCIIILGTWFIVRHISNNSILMNGYLTHSKEGKPQVAFKIGDATFTCDISTPLVIEDVKNASIPLWIWRDCSLQANTFEIHILSNPYIKAHTIGECNAVDSKIGIYLSLYAIGSKQMNFSSNEISQINFDKYAPIEIQKQILNLNHTTTEKILEPRKVIEYKR